MDPRSGEEKKEAGIGGVGEIVGDGAKESESDDESEELGDVPPDIVAQIGGDRRLFESEEELFAALVDAGVGDLPVVLIEGKPRLIMPSDQHNLFTTKYATNFQKRKGKWGLCSGTHKIHLSNGRSRDPDLSYWGYPRCNPSLDQPIGSAIPDVVIQFSWKNKRSYEEDTIDDMMNKGLEKDHGALSVTRPALGYLIKVRFSKKRTLSGAVKGSKTQDMEGLDIYRLRHGTTISDACDPNNSDADYWRYTPGCPEIYVTIAPQDLGITGMSAWLCGDYRIKVSQLFEDMQRYQKKRQSDGLAT